MKISYIIQALESFAPRALQEKWDNSGLQIALPPETDECTGVLLCLDVNEDIVAEAVEKQCNLIVSHHPLFFKGIKNLVGADTSQRAAAAAIRAGVGVYSAHTSLDSTPGGVSYAMAQMLGAKVLRTLAPAADTTVRLEVICPRTAAEDVRLIMLDAGAGTALCAENAKLSTSAPAMDNAPHCDSSDADRATMAVPGIQDLPGTINIEHTALCRVEADVAVNILPVLKSALATHPQASLFKLRELPSGYKNNSAGLGVIAELPGEGLSGEEFVKLLKEKFGTPAIRCSASYRPDKRMRKIAMCGGAGGEFIAAANAAGADAYVSADIRYHDFADARTNACTVFDIGHFESENCAKSIFYHIIRNKFLNFAVYYSEIEKNPVQYL